MGVFEMVVIIVVIGCLTSSFDNYIKHRNKTLKNQSQDADIQRMQTEIDRLTERVRVLERLATDDETRLRDEFKRMA
ncbi:MAG: hypothetical protein AAF742_08510 [Pseudomonadota bacterium]